MLHGVSETSSGFRVGWHGRSLISSFKEFSASIDKAFILAGGLGVGLSFREFREFPEISRFSKS